MRLVDSLAERLSPKSPLPSWSTTFESLAYQKICYISVRIYPYGKRFSTVGKKVEQVVDVDNDKEWEGEEKVVVAV